MKLCLHILHGGNMSLFPSVQFQICKFGSKCNYLRYGTCKFLHVGCKMRWYQKEPANMEFEKDGSELMATITNIRAGWLTLKFSHPVETSKLTFMFKNRNRENGYLERITRVNDRQYTHYCLHVKCPAEECKVTELKMDSYISPNQKKDNDQLKANNGYSTVIYISIIPEMLRSLDGIEIVPARMKPVSISEVMYAWFKQLAFRKIKKVTQPPLNEKTVEYIDYCHKNSQTQYEISRISFMENSEGNMVPICSTKLYDKQVNSKYKLTYLPEQPCTTMTYKSILKEQVNARVTRWIGMDSKSDAMSVYGYTNSSSIEDIPDPDEALVNEDIGFNGSNYRELQLDKTGLHFSNKDCSHQLLCLKPGMTVAGIPIRRVDGYAYTQWTVVSEQFILLYRLVMGLETPVVKCSTNFFFIMTVQQRYIDMLQMISKRYYLIIFSTCPNHTIPSKIAVYTNCCMPLYSQRL
jgi:hypothetical protein